MRSRRMPAPRLCIAFLLAAFALRCDGQATVRASSISFSGVTANSPLTNGIELHDGPLVMRITALRDDVIRIRAGKTSLPEDASWAVLPEARTAFINVQSESTAQVAGFRTASLHVAVERTTGLLTVRDNNGHIINRDAAALRWEGARFTIAKLMPPDEHYFGLGDKTGPSDRRGRAFTMWNTDAYRFQESTDPLYKSIPFFLAYRAGTATGVFLDNTWRTSFDFGKESPEFYTFGAVDGPVDYYIVLGPAPSSVVETYAWLTGKPPLPPLWTLGFQQSRYTYTPESRLLEVAARLRSDHIPADAVYLDIDFQDHNRPFSVDPKTFSDLPAVIAKLHEMHFHLVTITDLHIAKLSGHGYVPYDTGSAEEVFLHNPDGSIYSGDVWPGPSVFPDFTQTQTRSWWGGLYTSFVKMGVDGFWNDMNEPSIFNVASGTMPLDTVHRIDEPGFHSRTASHAELHNVYGMENTRATYDGVRALEPDVRPFVLTRASYAGGQRFAATWTGDNSSTWNHLRMSTTMLKSLGLSGFSFAGADVGGFAGTATPELLTRWIEVGAFQPIDRDHTEKGTGDQEPWIGPVAQEDIRRRYIETRYRLMPYLYTLADETARTGLPMERPLFLDYPDAAPDKHPLDIDPGVDTEFLLGHDLLIAPSPYPEEPDAYTVEFPSSVWYDYWTGNRVMPHAEPQNPEANAPVGASHQLALTANVVPILDVLPVYVRGGAIFPLQPLVQSTADIPTGPLTLRVYAGDDCRGELYADDGKSLAYTRGEYLRMHFGCTVDAEGLHLTISAHEGSFHPWWKQIRVELYGWDPSRRLVQENGRTLSTQIEHEANFYHLTFDDNGKGTSFFFQ